MGLGKKKKSSDEGNGAFEERDADFSALDDDAGSEPETENLESGQVSVGAGASSAELEKAQSEAAEMKDKYLRALAEFENYKKHVVKERSELLKYQGEKIFCDVLEVVDNFELALQHAGADPEKLKSGLELIYKKLVDLLSKWEVRPESSLGKPFDPAKHNAISQAPVIDAEPGTIISEFKKTYFYKDRLLRVGDVVVASKPEAEE